MESSTYSKPNLDLNFDKAEEMAACVLNRTIMAKLKNKGVEDSFKKFSKRKSISAKHVGNQKLSSCALVKNGIFPLDNTEFRLSETKVGGKGKCI